ncbi:3-keto-5-aminohexanoate cleavage protein [Fusibacter sp. JL216-2]|uniref:3-keto-5-aminohexanoate cleavage protein n=1 Tax=Fusibacter sp. JL216-2 TaxID=3071453 RepID=UPI003D3422D7
MNKLIITVAPTGNVPTKEMTPHVPLTSEEIVQNIQNCANLGASIAHIHVRDENLKPTSDRSLFKAVLDRLDETNVNIIRQVSTGARGGSASSADWRGQMLDLNVEMASLSTGSSNFPTSVNANSPELIHDLAQKMNDFGIKPEIEVFDGAMLHNAVYLKKKGILKGPLHFNLVMNVPGSLPGTPKNLMYLVDNLPEGSTWTVSGIGRSQVQMVTMAIAMGGHVRTGLEDVIFYEGKTLATNESLIERVVRIAKATGRGIATPDEARDILSIG